MTSASEAGRTTRNLFAGALRIFLGEALLLPTGLLFTIFITRRVAPSDFGLYSLTATLVTTLEWVLASTFGRIVVKQISTVEDWRPLGAAAIRQMVLLGFGATALVWLLAEPIANVVEQPALASYLRLFALDIPLVCLGEAHQRILVGLGRNTERAFAGGSRWVPRLLVAVVLVGLGWSVTGIIVAELVASAVELLASRYFIRPSWRLLDPAANKLVWRRAPSVFSLTLTSLVFDRIGPYALVLLGGTAADAGFLGAAQGFIRGVPLMIQTYSTVLTATVSRTLHRGESQITGTTLRVSLRAALMSLPLALVVAMSAGPLITVLLGSAYAASADAFGVLLIGSVAYAGVSFLIAALIGGMWIRIAIVVAAFLLAIQLVLCWWLIPISPLQGVVWARTIPSLIGLFVAIVVAQRRLHMQNVYATIARSAVLLALVGVLSIPQTTNIALSIVKMAVLSGVVVLGYTLMGEIRRDNWQAAIQLIRLRRPTVVSTS